MKLAKFITFALLFLNLASFSQDNGKRDPSMIKNEDGVWVRLETLGRMRIEMKDGTAKVKCVIREIRTCCIVYEKDRVLHDVMADKVKRIEFENQNKAIFFSEKSEPYLGYWQK